MSQEGADDDARMITLHLVLVEWAMLNFLQFLCATFKNTVYSWMSLRSQLTQYSRGRAQPRFQPRHVNLGWGTINSWSWHSLWFLDILTVNQFIVMILVYKKLVIISCLSIPEQKELRVFCAYVRWEGWEGAKEVCMDMSDCVFTRTWDAVAEASGRIDGRCIQSLCILYI